MPVRHCKDVLAGIDAVIDGDVSALERTRFSMHLAICPNCERYFSQYRAVRAALGELPPGTLPDDFSDVMRGVLQRAGLLTAGDDSAEGE
jgi:anti-sigma factor RsiW